MSNYVRSESFRADLRLFLVGMAMSLIAKGVALFPVGRSVDSYPKLVAMSVSRAEAAGVFGEFIAQGRIGQWALNQVLSVLGIIGPGANTFYVLLTMGCFVAVGVLLCRLWHTEANSTLEACIVGMFAIHPYHAEIFTFREATLCVGVAVLLATVGLFVAAGRRSHWIAGVALIVASLSLYQIAFNYAVLALIVRVLVEWGHATPLTADARPSLPRDVLPRAAALLVALIVYFALFKLSMWVIPSAATFGEARRSAVLPLSQLSRRAIQMGATLRRMFLVPEPLMPGLIKLLIALVLVLTAGLLTRRAAEARGVRRYGDIALVGVLLGAGLLSIFGVTIPLVERSNIDRTLSAVSVLVAGAFAIVIMNGGTLMRRFALGVAGVLLFSFAGVNNVALSEQLRVNHRDLETANRMIMRLEADSGFAAVKKVAVIGSMREYPLRFITVKPGSDVNVSAFARPWSKANLLREASGYGFAEPSPEDLERARAYCRDARPWPDPTSVKVLGDLGVIYVAKE